MFLRPFINPNLISVRDGICGAPVVPKPAEALDRYHYDNNTIGGRGA